MKDSPKVKALGEIALRTENVDAMFEFYRDVVGLEVMAQAGKTSLSSRSLKVTAGTRRFWRCSPWIGKAMPAGHSGQQVDVRHTTLHHLAFTIDLADYESERQRLEGLDQDVRVSDHAWVQWRSLYINDPDGNVVEFVCFDESIEKE